MKEDVAKCVALAGFYLRFWGHESAAAGRYPAIRLHGSPAVSLRTTVAFAQAPFDLGDQLGIAQRLDVVGR